MTSVGAIIGGAIGGAVGAGIWAAVGYFSGAEVGWVAWGIGLLAGLGAAIGNAGRGGTVAGGTAAILALASVLAGKWLVAAAYAHDAFDADELAISYVADVMVWERLDAGGVVPTVAPGDGSSVADYYPDDIWAKAVAQWEATDESQRRRLRAVPALANPDWVLSWIADQVVAEHMREGRELAWPEGATVENGVREADYPPDVWREAEARWAAMPADEQAAFEASVFETARRNLDMMRKSATETGFMSSFSPYDVLWLALAVITAFQIANQVKQPAAPADNGPAQGDQPS